MKIGIIGTGMIGGTLIRILTQRGNEVLITNSRGAQGAQELALETGAIAVDIQDVVKNVDAVIISIPFPAMLKLPGGLLDSLPSHVPVIDTGNYYPGVRDNAIPDLDEGAVQSIWSSRVLGRPIIKAFNDILVGSLQQKYGRIKGASDRIALAVWGADGPQKDAAMRLIDEEIGFDPVDMGSLEDSWRQHPGNPGYCCEWSAEELLQKVAQAEKDTTGDVFKAWVTGATQLVASQQSADVAAATKQLVAFNRQFFEQRADESPADV